MKELHNTLDVDPRHQFRDFVDYISNSAYLSTITRENSLDTDFFSKTTGDVIDGIAIGKWYYNCVSSQDKIRFVRTSSHIAKDSIEGYILAYNSVNPSRFYQNGKEVDCKIGHFVLYTTEELQSVNVCESGGYYMLIPRNRLHPLLRYSDVKGARVVSGDNGLARVLLEYTYFFQHSEDYLYAYKSKLIDQIIGLMALIFTPSELGRENGRLAVKEHLFMQLTKYIEDNISNPNLNAQDVARQFHLSPSELSRLLSAKDINFYEIVRTKRVLQTAKNLIDPSLSHLSISDIAYLNGFNNISHFSKCFKTQYACTPRNYRAMYLNN